MTNKNFSNGIDKIFVCSIRLLCSAERQTASIWFPQPVVTGAKRPANNYTHREVVLGIAGHEFARNFDFLIEQIQRFSNAKSRIL